MAGEGNTPLHADTYNSFITWSIWGTVIAIVAVAFVIWLIV